MPPSDFLLKLALAPLIIATATLVARRYGERIGGLMIGLPLTSGPVSVFFALEQGRRFAAGAAQSAMLGLIPVAVFCIGYAQAARRTPWYLSATIGIGLYAAAILTLSQFSPSLGWIVLLVPAALGLALLCLGRREAAHQPVATPWWDLPLRMALATGLIVSFTAGAQALGPKWSGLLSPFPIFTFVMVTFSHSQAGEAAAGRFLRGVATGLFAYLAFFIVVALLIDRLSLAWVYLLATLAALSVNGASLARLLWQGRAGQPVGLQREGKNPGDD